MKKLKLVMVGNGMAGVRTLEELLKIAPDLYDITVFGAEPHPNYNRILLSPVLAGEQTIDEIILNDWTWYADNHITLHTGFTVTDVDRVRRVVSATTASGERWSSVSAAPSASWYEGTSTMSGSSCRITAIAPIASAAWPSPIWLRA